MRQREDEEECRTLKISAKRREGGRGEEVHTKKAPAIHHYITTATSQFQRGVLYFRKIKKNTCVKGAGRGGGGEGKGRGKGNNGVQLTKGVEGGAHRG